MHVIAQLLNGYLRAGILIFDEMSMFSHVFFMFYLVSNGST